METRIYETKVYGEVKDFVLGRISAAQELLCQDKPKMSGGYLLTTVYEVNDPGEHVRDRCTIFRVETDEDHYGQFKLIMNAWYPYLDIEFDIDGSK